MALVGVVGAAGHDLPGRRLRVWTGVAGTERRLPGAHPASQPRPRVVGRVVAAGPEGPRVTVDGVVPDARGWDHFAR